MIHLTPIAMKIIFKKKIWFEAKAKLKSIYNFLREEDFQYKPGEECQRKSGKF
jgi:hypothetical protein